MGTQTRGDFKRLMKMECGGDTPKFLDKFWNYHELNPDVFEKFLDMAQRMQAKGFQRIGSKLLTEDLRYKDAIKAMDPDTGLKLSNDLTAYYARFLIFIDPSLADMITLKALGVPRKARPGEPPRPYDSSLDQPKSWVLRVLYATGDWPDDTTNGGRKKRKK